jgi:Domain of unknown function (DUF4390)
MTALTARFVRNCLLAGALLLGAGVARAEEIVIESAAIELTDEGFVVNADFDFEINASLESALASGLALHFVIECEMSRGRWYWLDERVINRTQRWRLSYNALTRQYRLSSGTLSQSFASLTEAKRVLARVRSWAIAERGGLRADTTYDVYLRVRLDTSQLPKPFQVSVIGNRDWNLASNWRRWRYTPPPSAERAP